MIVIITVLMILLIISLIMIAQEDEALSFFVGTSIILLSVVMFCTYIYAYKEGQIDALSKKKIAYELVKQDDGSTKWKPKENWNKKFLQ